MDDRGGVDRADRGGRAVAIEGLVKMSVVQDDEGVWRLQVIWPSGQVQPLFYGDEVPEAMPGEWEDWA